MDVNKNKLFFVVACSIIAGKVNASTVRDDIPYQTYRDFAENRGDFKVGNTNIKIYDKSGNLLTTLDKAPMIDFSNAFSPAGYGNFLNTQYISSVKHNTGYQDVKFGRGSTYSYKIVDRNDNPKNDYHTPRVNKLVTEVAPIKTASGLNLLDTSRFTTFYRVGSGTQKVMGRDLQEKWIEGGYSYLTGGVIDSLATQNSNGVQARTVGKYLYDPEGLRTTTQPGDSGSPLYVWDNQNKEWLFVANLTGQGGNVTNIWSVNYDFIDKSIADDYAGEVNTGGNKIDWNITDPKKSTYQLGGVTFTGRDFTNTDERGGLASGKNISLIGGGTLNLKGDIDQGAGTLTFKSDMTVQGDNDNISWIGGGLNIEDGKTVTWKVKGKKGDSLHKIGKGTLYIDGNGTNEGDISLGDGTLYLSQNNGYAFNNVEIVSGRGKVVLGDSKQVASGDNITFGYRGGTLDLNGNSLEFEKINAADDGAIIENTKGKAKITVSPGKRYTENMSSIPEKDWNKDKTAKKYDIYRYDHNGRTDWFAAKKDGGFWYFPTDQTSNDDWLYLSSTSKEDALTNLQKHIQDTDVAYHGYIKGDIDTEIKYTEGSKGVMVFDGGIDTPNGKLTLNNVRASLQGHPEIHAYNSQKVADILKGLGDDSVKTQPVYTDQKDWENRKYNVGEIELNKSELLVGRNGKVTGDMKTSNSKITFGGDDVYIDKKDGDGLAQDIVKGNTVATGDDRAYYKGDINAENTTLYLKNAIVDASIKGDANTTVDVDSNTVWNLTKDSRVGTLKLRNNGDIYLSTGNNVGTTLTTDVLDATNQKFHLNTNASAGISDRIVVNKQAIGGNNQLLPNFLGNLDGTIANEVILASAPTDTADNYFTIPEETSGFTVYKPNYKIESNGSEKDWKLVKKEDENNNGKSGNNNTPTNTGVPNTTPAPNNTPTGVPNTPGVKPIDNPYYIPEDNKPYIDDVKSVLNTQEAIFINENELLRKRLGDLHSSDKEAGIWFKNSTQENQVEDAKLKSNSMELGFDTRKGNNVYGIFGTYSEGKSKLNNGYDDFKYGGVGAYYSYIRDNGAFLDVVGKYIRTSQKVKLPTLKGETSFEGDIKKSPSMFIGSVQTGIRKETKNKFFIEPTVKVTSGYMEGYSVEGKDGTKAKVKSSTPVYGETGVQLGKTWGTENKGISVSTGVHYQKKLSKNSTIELTDKEGTRKYEMDTDRMVANISIDGKLTESLGVYGRVEKSFGGKFKTNYSGQVGFRYRF